MRILLSSLLFLITLFFGNYLVLVCGQCDSHQQSLLLQLKNHLIFNSSFSTKLVKWNQGGHSWDGVTCEEGRVTGLDLSDEFISAGVEDLSPLFRFHYLKTLNLAFNQFNGARISYRFGNLTNLSFLNLSHAGFTGQIPIGISHLTNLVTLDLSYNIFIVAEQESDFTLARVIKIVRLTLDLPMLVQNLTKLEELYLDDVNFSAHGKEWGKALSSALPNLRVLSLSMCDLSGPIDSSLAQLKRLSVVRLNDNHLSGPVPNFFAKFSNLTFLDLRRCEFYGIFPQQIFQVSTLHTLVLSDNPMLQGSLPEFSQNGALQTIDLSGCNFSGPIPNSMWNLTRLVNLDFSGNSFIGPMPISFSSSRNLTQLNLAFNLLHGSINSTALECLLNLVVLDLSGNSFSGSIPLMSLFKMTSLQSLILSGNQFTSLSNLSSHVYSSYSLYRLDLSYNMLQGQVPEFVFKITSLQSLILSGNQFTSLSNASSHVYSSYSLYELDLSYNMLQGQFPEFVFTLQGIEFLDLSFNNFSGIVQLDMILQLRNLSSLDLSYNSLLINANATYSTLPFPQLFGLYLAFCKLTSFPGFLKSQSHLSSLDLSNNQIHGEIPKWIWKLPELSYLNLSQNFLTNAEGPLQNINSSLYLLDLHSNMLQGAIPILPKVAFYLDYSHNNLTSAIPTDIGNYLVNTSFLSLSSNNFHGSIPHSIGNAESLKVLQLANNNLSGLIPQCLTTMSSLGVLNLGKNKFNGNISDTFGNCSLQTLDVNGNMLEGKLPKSLANCTSLEVLDFGNNHIHDTFPCYMKNISSLRVLVLRSNKFSGYINCSWYNVSWSWLQIIDLASNNFSGKLPKGLLGSWKAMMVGEDNAREKLKQVRFKDRGPVYYEDTVTIISKGLEMELVKILSIFTSIDMSCNNFYGSIPEVIGEFKSLYILNLSHNALMGQIPSSLGNMKQLESLDLSRNQLNGEIPMQLANLNFLSVLDLSFNQLVGRIPTGTQLQSFPEAAFQGNAGLYGCPLTDNCTKTREIQLPPRTSEDSKNEINWELVGAEIGFVIGFGIVILPLMFWKRWRYRYYKHVDRLLFRIFPQLDTGSRDHGRRAQTRF